MILRLVDRRSEASGAREWAARQGLFARLAAAVGPAGWAVDLVLVDDAVMARLNSEYRGTEGVTDVLSFSYLNGAGPGAPDLTAGIEQARCDLWLEAHETVRTDLGQPVVGEILLAPGFIGARCHEKEWPLEHELPLLVVHGCLHVLGWEHDRDDDRQAMRDVEFQVLTQFDLPHPLR